MSFGRRVCETSNSSLIVLLLDFLIFRFTLIYGFTLMEGALKPPSVIIGGFVLNTCVAI